MITDIYSQLQRDEGLRLSPYMDTVGKTTLGYGHNLDASPISGLTFPITLDQALQILHEDVTRITAQLFKDIPWLEDLDSVRQGVFQNLAFNMGVGGVLEFHHDLEDTNAGNYVKAAADMKASVWYTQVGVRAQRLCTQMATGLWQ